MTRPITLRNLTAQPLTVKLVERYEAPNPKDFPPNGGFSVSNISNISSLTSNFTSLLGKSTEPSHAELHDKAESFKRQEVDVRLEPFTTKRTNIKLSERGPNEILRLTFQGDGGGRWRIDTPTPSSASQTLTPLEPDPKHEYTGIYISSSSFLAILESKGLRTWMKALKDDTPLSALSIPGTHNSPTFHTALPSVRCQAVSPLEQLQNGIRFFDIRVQPTNPSDPTDDRLALVHGVFPISLTGPKYFRNLVETTQQFLQTNPSETVIMSLKREGPGTATDAQLAHILKTHYTSSSNEGAAAPRWYTDSRIPCLGEVRGKIILLRRFRLDEKLKKDHKGRGWCLNAENWAYNTPNCSHGAVCVQDFCEVLETENIEEKIRYCCEHFERAGSAVYAVPGNTDNPVPPPGPLYLNFLSASNFWKVGCWPDKIAAKLNPAVVAFLCERHDAEMDGSGPKRDGGKFEGNGGVGIVVCDWVGKGGDWDLVRCVVSINSSLLLKTKGKGWR